MRADTAVARELRSIKTVSESSLLGPQGLKKALKAESPVNAEWAGLWGTGSSYGLSTPKEPFEVSTSQDVINIGKQV